jgi:hypothetical protein
MTTRTTTIRTSSGGMRGLIGATAAGLAVLGGALLWQARPASETAAPVATTSVASYREGAAPLGGLAEQYRDEAAAQAAREAARVTTRGGLAELYAERQAAARAEVARLERMGGMAELYRDQAAAAIAR